MIIQTYDIINTWTYLGKNSKDKTKSYSQDTTNISYKYINIIILSMIRSSEFFINFARENLREIKKNEQDFERTFRITLRN
jgi:hypothetical protein